MAADDAAVIVTLRANLKDYEAALRNAVRSTERAAQAAEKAISTVGKGGGAGKVIEGNFKKSSAAIANDARVLSFQLNDIFSGLASGQGMRAVQVQLGQIAQQMTGTSLVGGARLLGAAFASMINPINLAVVAFGVLAGVAASYFSSSKEKAKEAADALKKQADELDTLADKYGKLFPALIAIRDAHRQAADAAEKHLAAEKVLVESFDPLEKRLEAVREGFSLLPAQEFSQAIQKYQELRQAVEAHKDPTQALRAVIDELNKAIAKSTGLVAENAKKLRDDFVTALGAADNAAKTLQDTMKGFGNIPGPGGGDWLTSPDRLRSALLGGTPQDAAMERWIDAIDGFTERIIQAESGGKAVPNAAGASSAFGQGQFTRDTWLRVFRTYFADQAKGQSDAALLALRSDLETNRRMIRAYAAENAKALDDAHQAVTERNLQLAHFLGAQGAINVLKSAPGTRISDIPGMGAAITANPSILGGGATREDVLAYAERRTNATKAAKEEKKSYDELVASINEKTAAQQRENEISGDASKSTDERTAALQREKAAQEAARVEKELNNAATAQGIPLTDDLKAKNHALAEAYAAAGLAADQLVESQKKANEASEAQKRAAEQLRQQYESLLSGALTGFVHDLQNGADAGEAFNNMLKNVASQIADLAIQMLIVKPLMNAMFPGTTGGGGSFFGLAAGGTVGLSGHQRGRNLSPALWAGAPRYAAGGMVGLRPGEVPIIAHRGEIIIPNARRLAGGMGASSSGKQRVDVFVSAAPSPLLDLSIQHRTTQAEQRAVARAPAVARDNNRRFAVP